MNALLIARRELLAYVRSPLGSMMLAGVLLIDGILFYWQGLSQTKLLSAQILQQFFYVASGTTMVVGLLLGTRLLAEEREAGTMTLLTTSPIEDRAIIAGKYLAAMVMLILATALTIYMPLLIFINGKVSIGHILVGYGGLLLLGSSTVSLGMFASSLAKSQVVAAILGATMLVPLLLLWAVAKVTSPPLNGFLAALALHHQNQRPFMVGVLEAQHVAYYVVVTLFFLLAATRTMEARRWK